MFSDTKKLVYLHQLFYLKEAPHRCFNIMVK